MKKLLGIVVLGLLLSSNAYAEIKWESTGTKIEIQDSVNHYTKDNYKIIEYRSVGDGAFQVITLEKRGHIIICTVRFRAKLNYGGTKCFEP